MKLEEAITYAIMSDGHGKTTDQIAAEANRIKKTVDSEKEEKRRLMAERGKARLYW